MGSYVPNTPCQRREMLESIGLAGEKELFCDVPASVYKEALDLPKGKAELCVSREMEEIAAKNVVFKRIFRGAGAYDHYIPAIVKSVVSKEEFVTAYTPYQAEISQGILQSIFEYQTMICRLTGMDAANASVYDGASAAAEAAAMCKDKKRNKFLISAAANPYVLSTVKTYCFGNNMEVAQIPLKDGKTDITALSAMLDESVAGVYIAQPNYFGLLEDAAEICAAAHAAGAKAVMGVNPISLAILKTPAECGADIAVGEGQPLGMPISYGGPYLGFMAAVSSMMRKLPGRIVGQTTDNQGRRGFVLTLQAREQHIKREKAGSNICSNEALCALTASVYLSAMGEAGLKNAAEQCVSKAHYLQSGLEALGLKRIHSGEFFHEFLTACPIDPYALNDALAAKGILGGLVIDENMLWCATEKNAKGDIDALLSVVKEAI